MMMRKSRRVGGVGSAIVSVMLATSLGCSNEVSGPTTTDFAKEREESAKRAALAEKARAGSAAAKAAVAQRPKPVERKPATAPSAVTSVALIDNGYTYDSTGKRDPFRSFTWDRPDRLVPLAEAGPLEQFDLTQLEVVAVVWRTGNARALLEDPSGESYIVGEGAKVGKNKGHVISIDDNTVVVKETYVDYLGQETTKDIEMRMRRNEGG
ncbi:MAG: pilus assembly protein PilP [Myxococcota bacterium]